MRHVKLNVDGPMIALFFTLHIDRTVGFRVIKGLPEGAKVIDIVWNPSKDIGVIVFEHESFNDVKLRDVPYWSSDDFQGEFFELSVFEQPEPEEEEPLIKVVSGKRAREIADD